jgi:hypothetical protein
MDTMLRGIQILAVVTLLLSGIALFLGSHGLALGVGKESGQSVPFAGASVHFEQNATDEDVEVVFKVDGGDEGLARLTVVSPDGRTVIDFSAPDTSTLGIRSFRLESPEPGNVKSLKSAYPEGVYTFAGTTATGEKLHGRSTLNHELPATASFLHPKAGARGTNIKDLKITWKPVRNMAAYIIEIEQDELEVKLEAKLPGDMATFTVPESFLLPGTEYKLSIGTVTGEGNISYLETTFTTAGKE